jgi:hypothetical protein
MNVKRLFLIAFGVLTNFISESNTNGLIGFQRKLAGSNCVIIERGKAPRYYKCIGCVIEEATACVDDLRSNKVN